MFLFNPGLMPPERIYAYVPGLGGMEKTWKPLVDKLRADLGGQWICSNIGAAQINRG